MNKPHDIPKDLPILTPRKTLRQLAETSLEDVIQELHLALPPSSHGNRVEVAAFNSSI